MEEGGSEGGGRSYGRTVVRSCGHTVVRSYGRTVVRPPPPPALKRGSNSPPVQRGEFSRNPAPCDLREKERGGEDGHTDEQGGGRSGQRVRMDEGGWRTEGGGEWREERATKRA